MLKGLARRVAIIAALLELGAFRFAFALALLNGGSGGGTSPVSLPNPLSTNSFTTVVANVTSFLITDIAVPLTAIMALIGGFQMITAAGNPEKFASGRKTLTYAAIGFVIVLLASSVTYIIKSIFQGS